MSQVASSGSSSAGAGSPINFDNAYTVFSTYVSDFFSFMADGTPATSIVASLGDAFQAFPAVIESGYNYFEGNYAQGYTDGISGIGGAGGGAIFSALGGLAFGPPGAIIGGIVGGLGGAYGGAAYAYDQLSAGTSTFGPAPPPDLSLIGGGNLAGIPIGPGSGNYIFAGSGAGYSLPGAGTGAFLTPGGYGNPGLGQGAPGSYLTAGSGGGYTLSGGGLGNAPGLGAYTAPTTGSYSSAGGSTSYGGYTPLTTSFGSYGNYTTLSSGGYTPPNFGNYGSYSSYTPATTTSSGSYGTYTPSTSGSYTSPSASGSYTPVNSGSYTPSSFGSYSGGGSFGGYGGYGGYF